ncbi:hypothetical protein V6C27_05170 [Peptococcaceae bacterium 1198_IL3148]
MAVVAVDQGTDALGTAMDPGMVLGGLGMVMVHGTAHGGLGTVTVSLDLTK